MAPAPQPGADAVSPAPAETDAKRARLQLEPDDAGAAALTLDEQAACDALDEFAASDAWACGANASGALGTGDAAAALRPKRIRARRPWAQLALGDSHAAGVRCQRARPVRARSRVRT
jgi:hypothetical protein